MHFKTYPGPVSQSFQKSRAGWVDKPEKGKRFLTQNGYTSKVVRMTPRDDKYFGLRASDAVMESYFPVLDSDNNRLYNKIVEAVTGARGELLTSVVEWESSLGMITRRATQLRKAYVEMRRFNLPEVARILSNGEKKIITVPSKGGKRGKKKKVVTRQRPTELWLEYWMGWAPLMGDIGHALEKLTDNINHQIRYGVGIGIRGAHVKRYPQPRGGFTQYGYAMEGRYTAFGQMKFTNPNLHLAHQLGFTNPVLTLWQTVPFSFIVDWFTNVGQVLGQMDNFLGVQLSKEGRGRKMDIQYHGIASVWTTRGVPAVSKMEYFSQGGSTIHKTRVIGATPKPRLTLELPKLSLTRAATAISLLVEIFLIK